MDRDPADTPKPHGHVQTVALAQLPREGMASLLAAKPCRDRTLVPAMIAARILPPQCELT